MNTMLQIQNFTHLQTSPTMAQKYVLTVNGATQEHHFVHVYPALLGKVNVQVAQKTKKQTCRKMFL